MITMSDENIGTAAVRTATPDDLDGIADVLADAFAGYAYTRWVIPADDHERRLRALQRYFAERVALPYGGVWVVGEGAPEAVSLWTRPDSEIPAELFTAPEVLELYGDRAARGMAFEEAMGPHRPAGPCWFLASIGVRRDRRGAGLGAAVLLPGLEAADRDGHDVYLETSDERNVRFYRRFGFAVTAETDLPDGGPRSWGMLRRAG